VAGVVSPAGVPVETMMSSPPPPQATSAAPSTASADVVTTRLRRAPLRRARRTERMEVLVMFAMEVTVSAPGTPPLVSTSAPRVILADADFERYPNSGL